MSLCKLEISEYDKKGSTASNTEKKKSNKFVIYIKLGDKRC